MSIEGIESEGHSVLPTREEIAPGFRIPYRDETIEGLVLRRFFFPEGIEDPRRAVVCVPGLAASGRSFARQEPLARRFDLRPLTGPLAMPFPGHPIESLARVLVHYLRDLDRPVLLGTSFGSLVAIAAAAELGRELSGLVLVSALASGSMVPRRYAAFAGAMLAPRPFAWAAAPVAARILGGPGIDEAARRELVRQSRLVAPAEMFRRVNAVLASEMESLVPRLPVPVLLIHGAKDMVIPLRAARRLADKLPAGRYFEMRAAGHTPYLSHPGAFNELLGQFLDEVLPPPLHH